MTLEETPHKPPQDTASLVKRLAGPSTTKAGLSKDQTEINRIIAEASKGSKFYENEKRKDKDLTERIAKILKQRDDSMRGVDIRKVETAVDHLLVELEAQRDLSQIIVHVDMDAFFANVELLYNPDLAGKPFGVGKGILSTASYEARKYGVRSGMAGFIAKKLCPDLIFVPINGHRYSEMSRKVMRIFKLYDPNMYPAGTDEAYLNITNYCHEHGISPDECVQSIRSKVEEETKLTVSAGIAPNKMLAKICSDKNKPNGQFHLPFDREAILAFMRDLSVRKIPGIGRVHERLLESVEINTCGDIYARRAVLSVMDKQFGLVFLLRTYLGIASNVVQPPQRHERKSIGSERTFDPLGDKDKILQKLEDVALELESDMQETGWTGRTVTLKFKLDTYQVFTRAKSLDRWITKKEDLFAIGKELLLPEFPLKLRLIGLRVTKLKDLRVTASPPGSIKKFFESAGSESVGKKRKLGLDDVSERSPQVDLASENEEGEDADAMPGFHEYDEADVEMSQEGIEDTFDNFVEWETKNDVVVAGPSRPRPPVSAPAQAPSQGIGMDSGSYATTQTSALAVSPLHGSMKPRSTGSIKQPKRNADGVAPFSGAEETSPSSGVDTGTDPDTHTCPICGKTMETDNQGLNAHVDFCLSRGAIRAAQSQAGPQKRVSDVTEMSMSSLHWTKDERKGKRKKG